MNKTLLEAVATFRTGLVVAVDERRVRVKVRVPDLDNLETGWLMVLAGKAQDDKEYWLPDEGEQVAVLLDMRGEDGLVLGAVYSEVDAPPVVSRDKWHRRFKDGSSFEYDRATHTYAATVGNSQLHMDRGQLRLHSNGSELVMDSSGVRVNGKRIDLNE
jgi:phage baseplate assembly protein V